MQNSNVSRFLDSQAALHPDRPALYSCTGEHAPLSFSSLQKQVSATARLFHEKGISQGTRTLLMVKPGLELVLCVFALFRLGAMPVVIDPGMGLKSFLSCVARTKPTALVGIPLGIGISHVFRQHFEGLQNRVTITPKRLQKATGEIPTVTSAFDDQAAILFTSGSTGPAKGVCYTHGHFDAQVKLVRDTYGIQSGEIDLPLLPVFTLFNPALGMATVVPKINPSKPASLNPIEIVDALQKHEVTNSFGSPILWTKIGRYCKAKGITLPHIKRILMAGCAVSPAVIELFKPILPNGTIHTPYGATEALPMCSIDGPSILKHQTATHTGKGVCVGQAITGNEVEIIQSTPEPIECLTPEDHLAPDTVGEIIVRGPSVTETYDALPEATSKAKIRYQMMGDKKEPRLWHRMGDLGYKDAEGNIWFCGRKSEIVQTSTGPLYTEQCEAIFNQHASVYRSALIGMGKTGPQKPAIVIQPEPGHFPKTRSEENDLIEDLLELGRTQKHTRGITTFFFQKNLPVDVRHNSKIHRLTLSKKFSKQ